MIELWFAVAILLSDDEVVSSAVREEGNLPATYSVSGATSPNISTLPLDECSQTKCLYFSFFPFAHGKSSEKVDESAKRFVASVPPRTEEERKGMRTPPCFSLHKMERSVENFP